MYSKGTKVNSPTLLKLTTIKRDLSQCLQEEKRQSKPTKTSTTNQFASSRANETNSITFVPFEAFYVVIEDAEGLHCPIFKEYPLQLGKDEPIGHFKVPRLPYPIFYWESPIGQCPFIPPLMNETNNATRKSSQLVQVEKGKVSATATAAAAAQFTTAPKDLRSRALRNSTAVKATLMAASSVPLSTPKFVFEPAMTDTSIITAKTNLYKHHRQHAHVALPQHLKVAGVVNPILKITPNISVNVNRATASATTPKHAAVSGNLRKISPVAMEQEQQQQQVNASSRKKEKNLTAAHRARPGFCECCCEKYSDLEKHVKEPVHRQFALQSDNYEAIDNFLNGLKRPYKAEYLLASYKAANESQVEINENSFFETSLIQNSPISPTTTTSHVTTARNYTTTKKSKQSIVSKRIKMIANTTTSSYLDEEDAEASGVVEVLSAANTTTAVLATTNKGEVNYISSPSCKRRKSFKHVQ
jgi:hypothetical protein